jgi:hypothetical protein
MPDDLSDLLARIRNLIGQAEAGCLPDELPTIEHTLTDGYASALALEGERWRLERQIAELARRLRDPGQARELRELALRLTATDEELADLRRLLASLRGHAATLRAPA